MARGKIEITEFEHELLREFIKDEELHYKKLDFSVRVGDGVEVDGETPEWLEQQIKNGTRLKVDAIMQMLDDVHMIVEVKKRAYPGAIGQLLVYKRLYEDTFKGKIIMALVCEVANADVRRSCNYFNINLWQKHPEYARIIDENPRA